MDMLERIAFNTCRSYILSSYVDDIFIIMPSRNEIINIDWTFNNIEPNIKLEMEHPELSRILSLLNFRPRITEEGYIFINFYKEAASRKLFVLYQPVLLTRAKAAYVRNEKARIN